MARSSDRFPAFQFYPGDWLSSSTTREMTFAARGLFLELLAMAWLDDGLPDAPERLRRRCGVSPREWKRLWSEVSPQFPRHADGQRRNPRQERQRHDLIAFLERSAKGGKRSVAARLAQYGVTQPLKLPRSIVEAGVEADPEPRREPDAEARPEPGPEGRPNTSSSSSSSVQTHTDRVSVRARDPRPPLVNQAAHKHHAFCGRCCVPAFLDDEFRRKLPGDPDANRRALHEWYLATDHAWQMRAIGDDDLVFWRARFNEWQGTTKSQKAHERRGISVVRSEWVCPHDPHCGSRSGCALLVELAAAKAADA